jgi:hypothetical protein
VEALLKRLVPAAFAIVIVLHAVQTTDTVVNRMTQVRLFAFGGVGFAGAISQGEKDYRTIFARSTAQSDFETLFAQGSQESKCYALVGMRRINPERFKVLAASLRDSKTDVITMTGCILERRSLASVLHSIESGSYL